MNLIYYLLEANLYLAAFYLLYVLLLTSETHYQLNRAYLLLTSAIAFIIPLLQLGVLKPELKPASIGFVSLDYSPATVTVLPSVAEAPQWSFADYTLAIYGAITLALFIHLIIKIAKLIILSKKGIMKRQDGFVVIEIPGENVAFSFFKYLFVNTELSSSPTILHHEEVHIRQRHSWDIVYLELLKTINWFNPIVYLLQRSIKEVHEFIADQQVVSTSENGAAAYADFLISNAYGLPNNQLTNSFFNKNLLKRRIIMLYQKRSGRSATLKYLLILPLLCGLLCASTLAFTKSYGWIDIVPKEGSNLNGIQVTSYQIKNSLTTKSVPNKSVDTKPSFPGNERAFSKFLHEHIQYPQTAKDNKISGRVFLQFVVETDGSLHNIKVLHSPGSGLGEEAVRVLKLSQGWIPGVHDGKKVPATYAISVNFDLNTYNADVVSSNRNTNAPAETPAKPLLSDTGKTGPIYNTVEVNPSFPGGDQAFGKFLRDKIRYPKAAKDSNITGRIFIQFVVETDGSLSDMKVLRNPGGGLGEEGMRVLALSPNWVPGTQNGKNVRVQYVVPINFSLVQDDKRDIATLYYTMAKIKYPQEALAKNSEGREFVSFTLNANKEIENIKLLRNANKLFDDVVITTLQNFKTISDGIPGVKYIMPVNFSIDAIKNQRTFNPAGYKGHPTDYQTNAKNEILMNEVVVFGYK